LATYKYDNTDNDNENENENNAEYNDDGKAAAAQLHPRQHQQPNVSNAMRIGLDDHFDDERKWR